MNQLIFQKIQLKNNLEIKIKEDFIEKQTLIILIETRERKRERDSSKGVKNDCWHFIA